MLMQWLVIIGAWAAGGMLGKLGGRGSSSCGTQPRTHSVALLDSELAGAHLGVVAEAVWPRVAGRLQN